MTPADLARRRDAELAQCKARNLALARHHRARADEAQAGGAVAIATTLRLLAANLEAGAALAEAERRDRVVQTKGQQQRQQRREAAQLARPGRRVPLLEAVATALAPLKTDGVQFKAVMARWEKDRIGSLRLDDLGAGRYRVVDEDGADDAAATYTRGYLQKVYSKAR